MKKIIKKVVSWSASQIQIEVGRLARQANSSVLVTYGGTSVLAALCVGPELKERMDFLPFSVHYQEKMFASGRIPGGFLKREGRPTEREVLVSRLIDRPLRTIINDQINHEVQIFCTLLSYDGSNLPDIPAVIAASAALQISGIPISENICACRVGLVNDELILNPIHEQMISSSIDLVIAGNEKNVVMIEGSADEVHYMHVKEAIDFGKSQLTEVLNAISQIKEEVGNSSVFQLHQQDFSYLGKNSEEKLLTEFCSQKNKNELFDALASPSKLERKIAVDKFKKDLFSTLFEKLSKKFAESESVSQEEAKFMFEVSFENIFKIYWKKLFRETLREKMKKNKVRVGKRNSSQIRDIDCDVSIFETPHGSALFTRGNTQALVNVTLGVSSDEQIVEDPNGEYRDRFMLHYNFPSYSVGEISNKSGSPSRRDIGHGSLAKKSILKVLPDKEEFGYTIRIVSDILESDGSSSMATVCASSLALMDAGVPIKKHIAGIAMGLVYFNDDEFHILSDITGEEDMAGDMDFKVTGTKDGVTVIQMDSKIPNISGKVIEAAFKQASEGINSIIDILSKTINSPRAELRPNVPKMISFIISKEKISEVIGPGGKNIKRISADFDVKIDIDDKGRVEVTGATSQAISDAKDRILSSIKKLEVGQVFNGKVVAIKGAGAFVRLSDDNKGWLHISEVTKERAKNISNFFKVGDFVNVKIVQVDEKGRIRLSTTENYSPNKHFDSPKDSKGSEYERRNFGKQRSSFSKKNDKITDKKSDKNKVVTWGNV